jgi:RNA recognition motif-containing protein
MSKPHPLQWPDESGGNAVGKRILYVGGLPDNVLDCELRGIFTPYGLVARAYVVRFKHTGKSAGYGFVEMGSGEQALHAVDTLEGTKWEGHLLRLYVTPYANHAV